MTVKELAAIAQSLGPAIREYVGKAFEDRDVSHAAHGTRIAALEQKAAVVPKDGAPGQDGAQGIPGPAGRDAIVDFEALAKSAAALIQAPKDGAPGQDGSTGARGETGPAGRDAVVDLEALAKSAAALVPAPKNGTDGINGKDADVDTVVALVTEQVDGLIQKALAERLDAAVGDALTKAIATLPTPKDGLAGPPGPPGKDGLGVAGALLGKEGGLVMTLSDGSVRELGIVVGQKGADGRDGLNGQNGKDGRDGLGFEDTDLAYDEQGRLVLRMSRDGVVKDAVIPGIVDRGVYREGESYLKGDGVSFGGSFFIAQKDTTAKPETNADWRLAVKRGRDGRGGPR